MRPIKFRAWDGDKMLPAEDISQAPEYRTWLGHFDHGNLMQYTGLKDKNGVEIYEGDIVEKTQGEHTWRYVIKWNDYYCEVEAKTIWRNFYVNPEGEFVFEDSFTDEGGQNLPSASKGEVIGNIYENHELLEATT